MSNPLARIIANFSKLLSGKVVGAVLSVVYLGLAARELGPEGFGILALMHGVIVFVGGIVAFSGWQTLVRYGQTPLRDGRTEDLRAVFRFTATVELALGLIAIVVAAIALPIAAREGGWGDVAESYAPWYALALVATTRQTPYGLLQLYRRFGWLAIHSAVMPLARLIGTLIVVALGLGLGGFIIAWLVAAILEGVSLWLMALFLMAKERITWPGFGGIRAALDRFEGIGRYAFMSNADYTLVHMTPLALPLLVGAVLGPAAAGFFALATRATNVLLQPAALLGQSSFEVVADLSTQGRWSELKRMLAKGVAVAVGTGLAVAIFFSVSGEMVMRLFGGPEFAAAGGILALIAIARAFALSQPALGATLAALGRPGTSLSINASTGLLLVPAMVVAMHRYGLDGAGYAMIVQAAIATSLAILLTFRSLDRAS